MDIYKVAYCQSCSEDILTLFNSMIDGAGIEPIAPAVGTHHVQWNRCRALAIASDS
jgi:hypothetical protein